MAALKFTVTPVPKRGFPSVTPTYAQRGFSLTELAVVLVIVGLLIGGMLIPLSVQQEVRAVGETRRALEDARDALVGFASVNGRLPCPAWDGSGTDTTNTFGAESFAVGGSTANGNCGHFYDGFLPAAQLGLTPIDSQGFLVDAWGNRVRYAVSKDPTDGTMSANADVNPRYSFTKTDGMKTVTISELHPDLHVCAAGPASASAQCTGTTFAQSAVLLVFSRGKNAGSTGDTGTDEAENLNANRVFVNHEPTPSTVANGEFDDVVAWLSPNILINRMITAGRLP